MTCAIILRNHFRNIRETEAWHTAIDTAGGEVMAIAVRILLAVILGAYWRSPVVEGIYLSQ